MPNTYSQIYIHAVFAVKFRENIITKDWRDNLHKYISGILKQEGVFPLAVGGWLDHVHILYSMPPSKSVSEIMRVIKTNSSKWINEQKYIKGKFQWQEGYGAFSNSKNEIDRVIKYIINQEEHHSQKSFKTEYLQLLRKYEIVFDDKYIFEFYE